MGVRVLKEQEFSESIKRQKCKRELEELSRFYGEITAERKTKALRTIRMAGVAAVVFAFLTWLFTVIGAFPLNWVSGVLAFCSIIEILTGWKDHTSGEGGCSTSI